MNTYDQMCGAPAASAARYGSGSRWRQAKALSAVGDSIRRLALFILAFVGLTSSAFACHTINSPDPAWSGPQGAIPAQSVTWTITNSACGSNISYSITAPSWVNISQANVTIPNNQSRNVTFSINAANANALAVGTYAGTVTLAGNFGGWTRAITLTVNPSGPATLAVTPATAITMSGPQGGAFSPASSVYALQNTGGANLTYSVSGFPSWLTVSPTSGTLAPLATVNVTVAPNAVTNSLTPGSYVATLNFNNTTNGNGNTTRSVNLTVNDVTPPVISNVPANITVNTPLGSATAVATWTAPSATDNVGVTSFTSTHTSGASFPIGVTTVTYTARDAANNTSTASFTVTVLDPVAPVITACPANITSEATGPTGATATWTAPTATDNSGSVTVTSSHTSGATFALGTTTVTYTATDPSGNAAGCSFTVTVQDTTAPAITGVPANITVNTPPGSATAVATWTAPTATDAVGVTSFTSTHASGASFPIGTTTVTYTATDAAGNGPTTASFTVTVLDPVAPVITACPANIVRQAAGPTGQTAPWVAPTATDNSGSVTLTSTHTSGATFPLGTTTVTYTATDPSTNTATCAFTVTVVDTIAPDIVGMPANITVNTPPGSATAVATWTAPTATDAVGVTSFTSNFVSGASFPVGVTTVTYTATDAANNGPTTASFTVTVIDNVPPVITGVPANITAEATAPTGAVVNFTLPTANDNVSGAVAVTATPPSGSIFPLGTTTVTFSATDAAGNTATATFQILVRDTIAPVITGMPANITVNTPPGNATAVATWTAPTATDVVGVTSFTSNFASGASFPIGVTTVTYTARDAANNGPTTASFTVTVIDNVAPVITACPANITREATGPTGATATWTAPTATDNSGTVTLTSAHASGATFPLGSTTVTYTATDPSTNTASCSFTVTVQDTIAPAITGVPANITVSTTAGNATAPASWTAPTATDAVGVATFTSTHASGASFPVGTTTVTYTAADAAGNSSTASFTVTVLDAVAPVFAGVPSNITAEATGPTGAAVSYTMPTATDAVDGPVTVTASQASGSTFPLGTTTVTFTAKDAANNTATATFQILVRDTIAPAIAGMPANITVNTAPGSATAVATWTAPTATDAVGVTSFTSNFAPGASFPVGTTTVTYTATDAAGNGPTTASFTVTVIDAVAPVISGVPANIIQEATGPTGAAVSYTMPTATDAVDGPVTVTTSHASGSTFPLGTTTVTFTAKDAANNTSTATFTVTVRDTIAPAIAGMPANIIVNTPPGSATAVVSWTVPTATDAVGVTAFTTNFAPGATFPVGTTTVTYTATDAAGNGPTTASFTVTVIDSQPPAFAGVPANITLEATGPTGAVVNYTMPTASDLVDGVRPVTASHASGSTFPLGTTTVTFTASDLAVPPNIATTTFQVTVRDTTPPVIGSVSNITVTAPDLVGAVVNFALPAAVDIVDTTPTVTASPASGTVFPIGVTTVTVTAVDDYTNQSTKTFTVTVLSPAQMAVTPATGLVSTGPQGQQGAPFAPTTQAYVVTNNGQVPMDFTVTGATAWVAPSPANGTLAPGASITVTVALTGGADALAAGVHNATIAFNNTTSAIGSTTRAVALTVVAPAAMAVTPATAFVASGPQGQQGGAFTPSSTSYVVQNTGALPMTFAVSGAPSWVTLSSSGATLAPGATQTVTVSLNAGANALPVGAQAGTISFTNTTNAIGNATRGVTLNVMEPARLAVTPADGLVATGFQGGPFSPSTKTFTLTNTGAFPLDFTAGDNQGWLDTAPASGTIPAGGSTTVTLSFNASANALANGTHTGTLSLVNATSGLGSTTRPATLTVAPNGQVVFKVVTSEGDGPFTFTSSASGLAMTLVTSGGTAQSSPVTLNPGTYGVTVTPPDGFGLTAVTCNDSDSTGNAGTKSASIVLGSAEVVTCTFTSANSRKQTVEVISRFMGRRNDLLLQNGPDPGRQIDRLIEASGGNGGSAGFVGDSMSSGKGTGPSRLNETGDAKFSSTFAAPGLAQSQRNVTSIPRSFEERLAGLGVGANEPREAQPGLSPFKMSGDTENSSRFSFATSLSQMMRFNADVAERKAKEAQSADTAGGPMALGAGRLPSSVRHFSPFDMWVEGRFMNFRDDRNKAATDGHFGVVYVGADYIVRPWLLIGALVQYDNMQQRSVTQAFDIKGSGWMAGPYATVRLSDNIFLQGRAAFGRSTNEVSPYLTYTDTFSTRRWLTSMSLVGRWQFGNWQIQPSASISYIEDVSSAYTDSLGVAIPGLKVSLGQFKAGPQFSYRQLLADGTLLEPRLTTEIIWNFASSDQVADFGGTLSGPQEVRGRVELGIKALFPSGVGLDLSSSYDGIGSNDFHSIGAKGTVRVPLQ